MSSMHHSTTPTSKCSKNKKSKNSTTQVETPKSKKPTAVKNPRGRETDHQEQSTAKSHSVKKRHPKKTKKSTTPSTSPGLHSKHDGKPSSVEESAETGGNPPMTPPTALTPKAQGSVRKAKGNSTVDPPSVQWVPEGIAKTWIEKADFGKTKEEYEKLCGMTVNVEKECKKWMANSKWNQSEDYPTLDSSIVKMDEYVNMTKVDVPTIGRTLIMGQLPVKNGEEAFWKGVFEKRATHVVLIVDDASEVESMFPQKAEDYKTIGQMWINNRRVEKLHETHVNRFMIEILPNGCSNSTICTVDVIKHWPQDGVHGASNVVAKAVSELIVFFKESQPDESALIVSRNGAGRSGFFLSLTVAMHTLESKNEPNIYEIVKSIRSQRPRAVDSMSQYVGLYFGLFYYIKIKAGAHSPLGLKSKEMSDRFAEAMAADAQKSQMGTTTASSMSTVQSITVSRQF